MEKSGGSVCTQQEGVCVLTSENRGLIFYSEKIVQRTKRRTLHQQLLMTSSSSTPSNKKCDFAINLGQH